MSETVIPTLPTGTSAPTYYVRLNPLLNAAGTAATNVITTGQSSITVTGVTDEVPEAGQYGNSLTLYLFGFGTNDIGVSGQTATQYAVTGPFFGTDTGTKDSNGKELYSFSAQLDTAGLSVGTYVLRAYMSVGGLNQLNGVNTPVELQESDTGTVTVPEFVPFTYVVHEDEEIVSVKPTDTQTTISVPANVGATLTTDGRYLVWTNGDLYDESLQTGAITDLTALGASAPGPLATVHSPTYANQTIEYPSFSAGGYTFGTVSDFDFNPNDGSNNPLPTVTDASGDTTILGHFGTPNVNVGYAIAASANGNAVLTGDFSGVTYIPYGGNYGSSADPQLHVTFLAPAPTLTISNLATAGFIMVDANGNGTDTVTGTSNAIGQQVELDLGTAGAEAALATVAANGTWTATFTLSGYTGATTLIASVTSAAGTPTLVSGTYYVFNPPAAPTILGPTKAQDTSTVTLTGTAAQGSTVTVYDSNGTVLGSVLAYGYQGQVGPSTFYFTTPALSEGTHSFTATDSSGLGNSAASAPFSVLIDLTPPTARVTALSIGTADLVTVAQQRQPTTTITGTLSATPQSNEQVIVTDAYGNQVVAKLGADGLSFSATIETPGANGSIAAFVQDEAGNQSATLTQPFTITPVNTLTQLGTAAASEFTSLSHNGAVAAFTTPAIYNYPSFTPSHVSVETLATKTVVDASGGLSGATAPSLSGDGTKLVLEAGNQVYEVAVATDAATLLSAPSPGVQSSGGASNGVIAENGRYAAFTSSSPDLGSSAPSLYEVNLATSALTLVAPLGDGMGDADVVAPSLSADGSTVAFISEAATLVANAPLQGLAEAYVATFDASGHETFVLASSDSQGNFADDGASDAIVSGNGRYVVFTSTSDNLVAGTPSGVQEVYRKDLLTGAITLVSATASGLPFTAPSTLGGVSDDGNDVTFTTPYTIQVSATQTTTTNQAVRKAIDTGALTLVSSPGLNPDGTEIGASTISGDGTVSAFDANTILSPTNPTPYGSTLHAYTSTPIPMAAVADDFAGTGHSALVLQNTGGSIVIEAQSALAITAATYVGNPGAGWHVVGTADYSGDGQPDILLQNDDSTIFDFEMSGTTVAAAYDLGTPGLGWHVRGSGDFNGDGKADFVLQNDNSGIIVENTNGASVTSGAYLGAPGPGWTIEGVADFNGDGMPDILLQNTNGALVTYLMAGNTIASAAFLGNPGQGWSVIGTGDYNGDGKADILLHNDNGADVLWDTNGTAVIGQTYFGNPGPAYTGAVTGVDLNADGMPGLLVQRTDSTIVGFTLNDAAQVTASAVVTAPGPGWTAVGNNPMQFIDGTASPNGATIAATPGADQFNFTAFQPGLHTISGFDPAQDAIALSAATFPTYATLQANEAPYQGGTFIALTPGSTAAALLIQGITPTQLTQTNFVFR